MWLDLGSFSDIDKDGDGILSRRDIMTRAASVFGHEIADLVTESVLGVADLDGDDMLTPTDMMVVSVCCYGYQESRCNSRRTVCHDKDCVRSPRKTTIPH